MIHLGTSKEVKLEKGDIVEIESRLEDIRILCKQLPAEEEKKVNNRINTIELLIQRGRV